MILYFSVANAQITFNPNLEEGLISRTYIIRPGEIYPKITFPSYKSYFAKNGPGNLTDKGRNQMERTGKEIYKYLKPVPSPFFGNESTSSKWICNNISFDFKPNINTFIYSLKMPECIESAVIIAKELHIEQNFSSESWRNIIEIPPTPDLLLSGGIHCKSLVKYIITDYLPNSQLFINLVEKNKDMISFVFEEAGRPQAKDFPVMIVPIADTVAMDKLLNNPLPTWVNETVYERLQSIANFFFTNLGKGNDHILKYSSGFLMRKILNDMKESSDSFENNQCNADNVRRVHVYLGQDYALALFLSMLDIPITNRPGFGAIITLDQWRTTDSKYLVKVSYKNYEGGFYKRYTNIIDYNDFKISLAHRIPEDSAETQKYCILSR
ncbi:unnamed protein product [Gordionus sp. m RMFG-2023]